MSKYHSQENLNTTYKIIFQSESEQSGENKKGKGFFKLFSVENCIRPGQVREQVPPRHLAALTLICSTASAYSRNIYQKLSFIKSNVKTFQYLFPQKAIKSIENNHS